MRAMTAILLVAGTAAGVGILYVLLPEPKTLPPAKTGTTGSSSKAGGGSSGVDSYSQYVATYGGGVVAPGGTTTPLPTTNFGDSDPGPGNSYGTTNFND